MGRRRQKRTKGGSPQLIPKRQVAGLTAAEAKPATASLLTNAELRHRLLGAAQELADPAQPPKITGLSPADHAIDDWVIVEKKSGDKVFV